jgi:hypothetical protein
MMEMRWSRGEIAIEESRGTDDRGGCQVRRVADPILRACLATSSDKIL